MTPFKSNDSMTRKFCLFILLVYSTILFSAEVDTLRSENTFNTKSAEKTSHPWTWGFYGLAFRNGYIASDVNYSSFGGGFYVEPSFGKLSDKWLVGFQTEYFSTGGNLSYSFFQNFFYLQFDHVLLGLNLYSKLGIGTSYITLTENGNSANATALRAAGEFEYGWQNLFHNNYLLRAGLRTNGVAATSGVVDMIGIQVSLGYRF